LAAAMPAPANVKAATKRINLMLCS